MMDIYATMEEPPLPGCHEVAVRVRVRRRASGRHIYDVVVPREDVASSVSTRFVTISGGFSPYIVHPPVYQVLQYLGRVLYLGREEAVGQQLYLLAHVRDAVRVRDGLVAGA